MSRIYIDVRGQGAISHSTLVEELNDALGDVVDIIGFLMSAEQYSGLFPIPQFQSSGDVVEGTVPTLGREVIIL